MNLQCIKRKCCFCSYLIQDQPQQGLDAYTIYYGPVPKCNMYAHYFIMCVYLKCYLKDELVDLVYIGYSDQPV